jgi:hypothetical protein
MAARRGLQPQIRLRLDAAGVILVPSPRSISRCSAPELFHRPRAYNGRIGLALPPASVSIVRDELMGKADGKRLERSASSSAGGSNSKVAALAKLDGTKVG